MVVANSVVLWPEVCPMKLYSYVEVYDYGFAPQPVRWLLHVGQLQAKDKAERSGRRLGYKCGFRAK